MVDNIDNKPENPRKILIIEDEHTLRNDVVQVLKFEGYDALGAQNGRVGVEMARQHLPDLVICDIMMPELDGYGVLIELHSDPSTSMIPFIFLTARVDRSDMRYGMELGADDYLTKPFTHEELLNAIRIRLEKHAAMLVKYEEDLNTLRNELTRTLPHELRTPLAGIMGYATMLLEDIDESGQHQMRSMVQGIQRSALRLHRLIENYLMYAQLEVIGMRGDRIKMLRQFFDSEPTGVLLVVPDAGLMKARAVSRESDFSQDVEDGTVRISQDDLKKMVEEVLDNAFKFSAAGTPIRLEGKKNGNTYCLSVTDEGRGMSPEQIERIGAFVQFNRKIYEQQGVGLGLIIARRLIELYEGKLTIQSSDKGTTVQISLPTGKDKKLKTESTSSTPESAD